MKRIAIAASAALMLLTLTGVSFAQTPIDDIQVYLPDGAPNSPYDTQVVTVQGKIYVLKGTYNSGTHYLADATGGITFFDGSAPAFDLGDEVSITGTIGNFSGEIQIVPSSYTIVTHPAAEVEPNEYTIAQLLADYEKVGELVSTIGTIGSKSGSLYELYAGTDTIPFYIDSDTGIDQSAIAVGDEYKVIGPCVNYNTLREIKPRRQGDLVEDPLGDPIPVIDQIACDDWSPETTEPITVSARIIDNSAVSSAALFYRDDSGDSTGAFVSVAMSNVGGDTYAGTIPATHTGRQVDFYVTATDDGAQTTSNPAAAPAEWHEVAVGFTSIYDVQWVHPDSSNQSSPLNGKVVNVRGRVTAGTGDAGAASKFVMQDVSGAYSGILVYEGSGTYEALLPGDLVEVGGYVDEYSFLTELQPHSGTAVEIISYGLPEDVPDPVKVSTRVLADDTFMTDGDGRRGEAYESVYIRTAVSEVMGLYGVDGYLISDTGVRADSVRVDPLITMVYQPVIGDFITIKGFMDYYYGYDITPIRNEDIVAGITGVGDRLPETGAVLRGISSIHPNPFNPQTEIKLVMDRADMAELRIFNIRGELVRTLHNGRLAAGETVFKWDGTNSDGHRMGSGTYFVRARVGTDTIQVEKLSLVK